MDQKKKLLLQCIDDMTADVGAVQRRVLAEILARNADAEYLASCGLSSASGAAAFRAKVPVATYEDLEPYILRVAAGDRSPVLTGSGNPVSEFLVSSGTSGGEPKLIPAAEDELDRRLQLHSLVASLMNQCVPGLDEGSGLYFHLVKPEAKTAGGLPARNLVTSLLKSDRFRNLLPYDPQRGYTSPAAAVLCEDAAQSMYAQMACGLRHRRAVARVGAAFASGLLRAVDFLQRNWRSLADDIEAGAPGGALTDPSVRAAVAAALRPADPDLARLIRAECSHSEGGAGARWGAGIIRRLWPNARCLDALATGAMAQYVPALDFYSAGLPIASTVYAASECHLGINLDPLCRPSEACYTLMPTMAYFEFLPLPDGADDGARTAPELVELARVEPGREYELVVTTYGGLSRYRVGDVLRAEAGLHHNSGAPRFRFVRRAGVALSVDVDKTDEAELQRAVARASAALPRGVAVLLDYTSRVCADAVPGHYVVYWELQLLLDGGGGVPELELGLERCCVEMEAALGSVYREGRAVLGSIGPLEIRVVRPGTFEALADLAVSRGASLGQYKVPRCVTVPAMVDMLDSRVVSRHSSTAVPHWAPPAPVSSLVSASDQAQGRETSMK